MDTKIGCDLVYIPQFIVSIERSGGALLEKLFTPYELGHSQADESLAGFFAAKEAFLKASGLKFKSWQAMEIYKLPSGKPAIRFSGEQPFESVDVSISHDGDYAMAVVIVYKISMSDG